MIAAAHQRVASATVLVVVQQPQSEWRRFVARTSTRYFSPPR
jgi:hypothetical protein